MNPSVLLDASLSSFRSDALLGEVPTTAYHHGRPTLQSHRTPGSTSPRAKQQQVLTLRKTGLSPTTCSTTAGSKCGSLQKETKPNSNKVLVKSSLPGEAVISSKRWRSEGILPSCMDRNQNKCDNQVNNYRHIAAEAIH